MCKLISQSLNLIRELQNILCFYKKRSNLLHQSWSLEQKIKGLFTQQNYTPNVFTL